MMRKYRLTRDVTKKECPWLERTYKEGETVSDKLDETPFFELPENSLIEI
jgi:hypothetical protein